MATEPILIPDATTQPAEYKQALLDLIGETDPIATLGSTVEKWRAITARPHRRATDQRAGRR